MSKKYSGGHFALNKFKENFKQLVLYFKNCIFTTFLCLTLKHWDATIFSVDY